MPRLPWKWSRRLRRYWYEALYLWPPAKQYFTNNAGFAPADGSIATDFPNQRYQIQLYAEVLQMAGGPERLRGRAVLEVGAGRGGGLVYIAAAAAPRELVGIDPSFAAVRQARRRGVDLRRGFAERLPFADRSFDYVLCVDSINLVSDPAKTFLEMERILAPDGTIVTGDFVLGSTQRARQRLDGWAAAAGLNIAAFRDVTANVQRALREDQARNREILATLPKLFRPYAVNQLGLEGSPRYERWQAGQYSYYLAALTRADIPNSTDPVRILPTHTLIL